MVYWLSAVIALICSDVIFRASSWLKFGAKPACFIWIRRVGCWPMRRSVLSAPSWVGLGNLSFVFKLLVNVFVFAAVTLITRYGKIWRPFLFYSDRTRNCCWFWLDFHSRSCVSCDDLSHFTCFGNFRGVVWSVLALELVFQQMKWATISWIRMLASLLDSDSVSSISARRCDALHVRVRCVSFVLPRAWYLLMFVSSVLVQRWFYSCSWWQSTNDRSRRCQIPLCGPAAFVVSPLWFARLFRMIGYCDSVLHLVWPAWCWSLRFGLFASLLRHALILCLLTRQIVTQVDWRTCYWDCWVSSRLWNCFCAHE